MEVISMGRGMSTRVARKEETACGRQEDPDFIRSPHIGMTRRELLMATTAAGVFAAVCLWSPILARAAEGAPTPSHIEGPYYKLKSPLRTSLLEHGMAGTRLVLKGRVLATDGTPIRGALVDFWQADASGVYDNEGYRLRGHQFTDEQGRYALETIVPGNYPGRTAHIHVKVQAPGQPVLTTQLFFPEDPRNRTDWLYKPGLLMQVQDAAHGREAVFDFVLKLR
jgi:protocatechuate 3,4-dioxygenase beta subunit